MKVSCISPVAFRENSKGSKVEASKVVSETADNKQSEKESFIHSKNAPYIIGGVAVTTAAVLGIIGVKKGWFSKGVKQVVKDGECLLNKNPEIPDVKPVETPSAKPPEQEIKIQVEEDIQKQADDVLPSVETVNEKPAEIVMPEPTPTVVPPAAKEQKLDKNVARVSDDEVIDAIEDMEEFEKIKLQEKLASMPKYLTKYMTPVEALEGIESGTITPLQRAKMFIKEFDNNIEALVRNLDNQYPVINNLNKGLRRYQKDFISAFDSWIADKNSGYRGTYKVIENTIHESRPDGSRVIYTFDKGPEGGLRTIQDIPEDTGKLTGIIHFNPERYMDFGNGIGIQHLDKMEFVNSESGAVVQSIEINPVHRSFHNVLVNNPRTGKPVLKMERTAEPNHLYYNVEMFNSETGERISKINTKNLSE